jgi:hypothetical protein
MNSMPLVNTRKAKVMERLTSLSQPRRSGACQMPVYQA